MYYIQLKKYIEKMSESLISSFLVSHVSESLRSLTKNEQIAQVAHFWAKTSHSLGKPMNDFHP